MRTSFLVIAICTPIFVFSQSIEDTLHINALDSVFVKSYRVSDIQTQLQDVHGTYLIGGRKTEVLSVQDLPANLAEKTGRQIFAKVPGAFVYDMDGSGNQVNISTRGLDPHRSWEYNVRQNGILVNSDIYGYPASHYSLPMEAVQNIEIIRGTASLQYGAEFGGMINYVTKTADQSKKISFESLNSAGSYGLYSTFNALGGKVGKLSYYTYFQYRVSDGYRKNSHSDADAQFVSLNYDFSDKLSLKAEFGRSWYRFKSPGPLTDSMFYADPKQATRDRNYYSPDIYVPSMTLNWNLNKNTTLQWILSGLFGNRSSVEFEGFADKPDIIDPVTLQYKPRAVNIDNYNSKTTELRLIHHYQLGSLKNVLSASMLYMNNNMRRRQQGQGTTGSDYDLSITGDWGRDLYYKSSNIAFSIENMIYLTPSFTVSPGFRYDHGKTDMVGYISYLDPGEIPNRIDHHIPAFGINSQYRFKSNTRIYGGISQAYRPVLFKDIIPSSSLEKADKDLEDAFGYNAELGINGRIKNWLKYDVTLFRVLVRNKLGNLVVTENNESYIYKTNIGDGETNGVEMYAEVTPLSSRTTYMSFFTSTSLMKGTYQNAVLAVGNENQDISGNEIESVPRWISRNGVNFNYKKLRTTLQYSYVDESFSDPTNVSTPTSNGAKGLVPSYGIWDFNVSLRFADIFIAKAGINNIANHQYFTKRPLFYPGPGVWSSDGRGFVFSLGVKI